MSILKQIWTLVMYEKTLCTNDIISITEDDFHYLIHVLRLQENDIIHISNGIGTKATGTVLAIRKKDCDIRLTHVIQTPQDKRNTHLLLAYLKPTSLEESIFVASELGINFIHLFPSERISTRQKINLEKLQKISNEAIKISKSAYSAKIIQYNNLEECLTTLQNNLTKVNFIFCDETSLNPISNFRASSEIENICVIIGPEASYSIEERTKILNSPHCVPVSLGVNILRSQTAVACASFVLKSI